MSNSLPEKRREAEYTEVIGRGTWQVRVVKLADAFDNVSDAAEPALLEKAMAKARRVLSVVGEDDPRLTRARDALRGLLVEGGTT